MVKLRLSPSGPFVDFVALNATGTYQGNQVAPPPPLLQTEVEVGFRPIVVQIIAQASAGPDTGIQIAKTQDMPDGDAFVFDASGAGFQPDTVTLTDTGFIAQSAANADPSVIVSDYFFFAQG